MIDLEKPLDPELEYFDATPSIEVVAEEMRKLYNLLVTQISINASVSDNLQGLHQRVSQLEKAKSGSSIILPGHDIN